MSAVPAKFDPQAKAAEFRKRSKSETTLAKFCKNPPKNTSAEGAKNIAVSCRPQVLAVAGDAWVFDVGDISRRVVFRRPVRRGDICDSDAPMMSICGGPLVGQNDMLTISGFIVK